MLHAKIKRETVNQILLRRNISQNHLARRLRISSGYCSQILAGTRFPSPKVRARLMRELDSDFDTIFEAIIAGKLEVSNAR